MAFAISIYWENPAGTRLTSTQFDPGQPMHLSIQVRGVLGLPESGLRVQVDIHRTSGEIFSPILLTGQTNAAGNKEWDFTIPNVIATADAVFTVYPVIGSVQETTIKIGIGESPEEQEHGTEDTLLTILKWTAIGAAAIGLIWLASKAAPTVVKNYKSIKGG